MIVINRALGSKSSGSIIHSRAELEKGCQLRGNLITDTTNGILQFSFQHTPSAFNINCRQVASLGFTGIIRLALKST